MTNPGFDPDRQLQMPGRFSRVIDFSGALVGATLSAPAVLACAMLVWASDRHNPFYVSLRIGRNGVPFRFVKIRTMVPNADRTRVDTTVSSDNRLLKVGRLIRTLKFDELPQFWHVIAGQMALVGPRPNVPREVALYTATERRMLAVRPGLTDYASVVFADLASLLDGRGDPNLAYNQLVRPWKSALSLHYLATRSIASDLEALLLTVTNSFARRWTLRRIAGRLELSGAPADLARVATRLQPLTPAPPPGGTSIVSDASR